MKDGEITKLFKYMEERFDQADEQRAEMKREIGRVYEVLDGVAGRLDIETTERSAHAAQLDRHQESIDHHDQSIEKLDHRVAGLEARAA